MQGEVSFIWIKYKVIQNRLLQTDDLQQNIMYSDAWVDKTQTGHNQYFLQVCWSKW